MESKQPQQHWQDLADLLGLPPEKSGAPSKPAPPAPRVETPPAPVTQETAEPESAEVDAPEELEQPRLEAIADDTGAGWEAEFDAEEEDTAVMEDDVADDTIATDAPAHVEEAAPGEEKPRRGRRRRRRGRRRGGDRADGAPHDREAPERSAAPRGRQVEEERRRAHDADEVEEDVDADEKPAAESHALSFEDTDFTNWNVPSWQELISSLYRPER